MGLKLWAAGRTRNPYYAFISCKQSGSILGCWATWGLLDIMFPLPRVLLFQCCSGGFPRFVTSLIGSNISTSGRAKECRESWEFTPFVLHATALKRTLLSLNHSPKYSFQFPWTFVARGVLHTLPSITFRRWLRIVHFIWAYTLHRNPSLFYHFQDFHT